MKVRTQLVLAFLFLAILPLTAIVLFSYFTSQKAFRQAVEAESGLLAEEMGDRLETVRSELGRRLEEIGRLPSRELPLETGVTDPAGEVYADLIMRMGEVAPVVDWLDFEPVAPGVSEAALEPFFIYPSKQLVRAVEKLNEEGLNLEEAGISQEYVDATIRQAVRERRQIGHSELKALEAREAETKRLLGAEITSPVRRGESMIGYLTAQVPALQILRQVMALTPRDQGEVPFALDDEGGLYVERSKDRVLLEEIAVAAGGEADGEAGSAGSEDWIVVKTLDPESGITFGIARPIEESLRGIRRTAVRNFAYGLGMVVLALVGVLWLSHRMTRNLGLLTEGAEQLARGDLDARVSVESRDEFGQLATTINRMAQELGEHQDRLLEEERLRKEQEIQQRLLEAENKRKSQELEEARELQLSLLPKVLPTHPRLEIAVFMRTATEVGGDYYDFFPSDTGDALTVAIGDAAGHGAKAGTMVTVVKGLFTATPSDSDLPELLENASRAIKQMNLGRMHMAVSLARIDGHRFTMSAAGMPPALFYRQAPETVEEIALEGTPLGSLAGASYGKWECEVTPGDTLLFMTDGFPEVLNADGEPMGYTRVRSLFEDIAGGPPQELISRLADAASSWHGDRPLEDDITFVVMKVKGAG